MANEDQQTDPTPDDFVFCGQRHESTYVHKLVQEGIFMGPKTGIEAKRHTPSVLIIDDLPEDGKPRTERYLEALKQWDGKGTK